MADRTCRDIRHIRWRSVARRRRRIGLSRRIGGVLRHVWLVVVPGLCASHEYVGVRLEPARVVERAHAQSDEIGASPDLHIKRRATVAAENADDVVAAVGFGDEAPRCALQDAEPCAGDAGGGNVRGATLALAVAAMTAQGEDWFSYRLVADCTTETAACSGVRHLAMPDCASPNGRHAPQPLRAPPHTPTGH